MMRTLVTILTVAAAIALALPTSSLAAAPSSTPVAVASTSWTSPSQGWVLGTQSCPTGTCLTLAQTQNAGDSWSRLVAPATRLAPSGGNGVQEVHFADAENGWAFYPQLHATHDGAASWQRIPIPGGGTQVLSLTSAGGFAYAVVSTCTVGNPSQCTGPGSLWRTPVATNAWIQVPLSLPARGFPVLSASESVLYLTGRTPGGAPFLAASTDGLTWTSRPVPCADPSISSLRVASAGGRTALLLCSENVGLGRFSKVAYATTDTGRTDALRGEAPTDGQPLGVAAEGRVGLIAVSGGDSHILRSDDAGRTWTQTYTGPSEQLADPQLVGPTGAVVSGPAYYPLAAQDLLLSHDAGLTWAITPVAIGS